MNYSSQTLKKDSNIRTCSERIFSRLLSYMQKSPVGGLNPIANHCPISLLTVLLVALTTVKKDVKDQIRFIKSFVPNFKPEFREALLILTRSPISISFLFCFKI